MSEYYSASIVSSSNPPIRGICLSQGPVGLPALILSLSLPRDKRVCWMAKLLIIPNPDLDNRAIITEGANNKVDITVLAAMRARSVQETTINDLIILKSIDSMKIPRRLRPS